MPYIFGKLWHLAIIWAIRKAFQCILQGVRILLANHTRISPTSENDSYQNEKGQPANQRLSWMMNFMEQWIWLALWHSFILSAYLSIQNLDIWRLPTYTLQRKGELKRTNLHSSSVVGLHFSSTLGSHFISLTISLIVEHLGFHIFGGIKLFFTFLAGWSYSFLKIPFCQIFCSISFHTSWLLLQWSQFLKLRFWLFFRFSF